MVNQFVMALSHDFRTSLATIETSRYLIERFTGDERPLPLQAQLQKIRHAVHHVAEQLNNLHMVSSLSDPRLLPCRLNQMIESLIAEHALRAQQKKQVLIFSPDEQLPVISADEGQLRQAIQHVVLNALIHTGEGGEITLRTYQTNHQVAIEVCDNGEGIAPEKLPYIFEPFYKADLSRTLETGGVGLGLSIVKMIVEAHQGEIAVKSEVGRGSVFTILLPITAYNLMPAASAPVEQVAPG